jgi:hypothetical protein
VTSVSRDSDDKRDKSASSDERKRQRVRLARLESDMAYFQARLELIGEPNSSNRAAQRKVFNLLHKTVASKILKAKRRFVDLS